MHSRDRVTIMTMAMVLAACGGEPEQRAAPPPVEETVFKDMTGTMDKARAVQQTMDARAEQLDRELKAREADAAQQ